jgi:CHAD domain-containing protein
LKELREAAEHLAGPRDAHVKVQALEKLGRPLANRSSQKKFRHLHAALQRDCTKEVSRFRKAKGAKEVRRILRKQSERFANLRIQSAGWAAIGPGLKRSYRRVLEARARARQEPSPSNLHTWRKRVKDLWYNVQLLERIRPEQMSALTADLERLSEFLGDDHDLQMLRQSAIEKSVDPELKAEIKLLIGVIEPCRAKFRRAAFELGGQLFEEKPSDFCKRIHRYWKRWKY